MLIDASPSEPVSKAVLKAVLIAGLSSAFVGLVNWGIEELKIRSGRHSTLEKKATKKKVDDKPADTTKPAA